MRHSTAEFAHIKFATGASRLAADRLACLDLLHRMILDLHGIDRDFLVESPGIDATDDAARIAGGRGVRAARLKAIVADIEKNLANGDVRPDALARRHGVSTRYIRKLFEGEGTSLSQFVLGRRLALVRAALVDPRLAHRTIGAIAYDAGFGDLSTFNHAFRRRFGMTPSDLRAGKTA